MVSLPQALTLEEFLELPERKPALEFADGTVTQKVAPKGRHSTLQGRFSDWINHFAVPRRLAYAFPELRTTFGGASYVPDIAVYRWERIPRDPSGEVADDFTTPPDVAVEIVSPRQSVTALVRRCLRYVSNGVPLALLINPGDRSVLAFRPGVPATSLRGADPIDSGDILPGLRLTVQELFTLLVLQ